MDELVLAALGVLLVSFGSGIITASSFGAKNHYHVDSNRELFGFGAANLASGLFGGFPVTSSDSRTAVNDAVGGKTQVAALVSAAALLGGALFLGNVLAWVPVPALPLIPAGEGTISAFFRSAVLSVFPFASRTTPQPQRVATLR